MISETPIDIEIHAVDCGIPRYMIESVVEYIITGRKPGNFLSAVINNDLKGAFAHADDINIKIIRNYVQFFYNYAPRTCWGSPGAIQRWQQIIADRVKKSRVSQI